MQMFVHPRFGVIVLAAMAGAIGANSASATLITGFEAPEYVTGTLVGQNGWNGGTHVPRIQTASEIAAELQAAGLNPANPVHGGDQAILWTYTPGEPNGGFMRVPFTGLETEPEVVMSVWARPLTPGSEGSTIGFNQGNTFVGIMDETETRAAAYRFGVIRDTEGNITGHTIDYASATAGSAVWVPSGLSWEADTWYNFRFELNYNDRQYDFFVNDVKVNDEPIWFYNTNSTAATRVFISRGTNQAGQILDDFRVVSATETTAGDFNGDGNVDGADFVIWQTNFPNNSGTATLAMGDANGDGNVDGADFVVWQTNFPFTSGSGVTAVPEPASIVLVLGGAIALAGLRGRRR